ncbi:MAG: ATP-binding cassette domain-containing protein [Candidatus Aminicenantes bacterium]|nr:ATP-binding cassette domain-containing protein [Candidatus Aminicenantes bacterium]
MTNSTGHLSIRNLSVSFGRQSVLKDVSLDIPDRKVTVIIGPSGCGKTTLLRALNRLLDSEDAARVEGTILVDGEDIYDPKTEVFANPATPAPAPT